MGYGELPTPTPGSWTVSLIRKKLVASVEQDKRNDHTLLAGFCCALLFLWGGGGMEGGLGKV
jgi:hypothetical protein